MKSFNDYIKSILGVITILAVFGYLFGITFTEVKLSKDIVPQVLIAIVAFGKDIYNYFFGSSQGAAKKDEVIAGLSETTKPAVTTSGDININNPALDMAPAIDLSKPEPPNATPRIYS